MRPLLVPATVLALVFTSCSSEDESYDATSDVPATGSDQAVYRDTAVKGARISQADKIARREETMEARRAQVASKNVNLPAVGSELPAIAAFTMDGTRVDNSTFLGKTTLINLWFYH
jgi:hypothetical protein